MGETVERERPDLLAMAVEIVGEDPFSRAEQGTMFAQPAIFCASLAGWTGLGCPPAELMAGHSLGEFAALVAAGAPLMPNQQSSFKGTRTALTCQEAIACTFSNFDGRFNAFLGSNAPCEEEWSLR